MIKLKIDLKKIDKKHLFVGEKGTYLDVVLIETPDSKYGDDYVVIQDVSKEQREAGVKGAILGNARIFKSGGNPTSQPTSQPTSGGTQANADDDLPF